MGKRSPFLYAALLGLLAVSAPLIAQERSLQWSQTGALLDDPYTTRKGFFLSASYHAGAEVIELTRALGGLGLRAGYGMNPHLFVYLQNDWTVTSQFDVFFHFIDFYPHIGWFVWKGLYLMSGGGYTIARTSTGTTATGFSVRNGVTRTAFGGAGGIGYELYLDDYLSVNVELEGIYRRISGGNYTEPVIRGVVNYLF